MQCICRNKNLPMVYEHLFLTRSIYPESYCISFIPITHPFILHYIYVPNNSCTLNVGGVQDEDPLGND